jgi:ferredoxin/flavodoxin
MNKTGAALKIAVVFFSATHVTETIARKIRDRLAERRSEADLANVTSFASRHNAPSLDRYDGFVFGFPVYADFAPRPINDWLPTLDGRGRPCALFLTYGGRSTGYAHFHTAELLSRARFRVLFTAEFVGRHTFNAAGWRVLPDRPDESDFAVARDCADLALERFAAPSPAELRLQKPFKYRQILEMLSREAPNPERRWTNPVRVAEACGLCRRCETECPAAAFNADTGLSDPAQCIECLHCVTDCPEKALAADERMAARYPKFLEEWHLTEEMMRAKQSRIITDFRQAVC